MQRQFFLSLLAPALLAVCARQTDTQPATRIAIVSDLGGLGDRSYNDSANAGLLAARDQLGVGIAILQSRPAADYLPNLTPFASKRDSGTPAIRTRLRRITRAVADGTITVPSTRAALATFGR